MAILERVKTRLDENVSDDVLNELIQTISDRLCLRLNENELPVLFESICVDAVVKMYRRTYYEGISSEGTDGFSTSFIDDILSEYSEEIYDYKNSKANQNGSGRVVKFL